MCAKKNKNQMIFTSPQDNPYSFTVKNFHNFSPSKQNIDRNKEASLRRNLYIEPHLPYFSEDGNEDKNIRNDNLSHIRSIFPILINYSEITSSEENIRRNNILNIKDSKKSDVNDSNVMCYIDLSSEKSTKDKTKKNQIQIFKIIKLKKSLGERYIKKDNIVIKIVRHFFNNYLVNEITKIIKDLGSRLYFDKFPQNFILNTVKKNNKDNIWRMKLIEIFSDKELYTEEDKIHFARNKDVIEYLKSENNKNILEDSKFNIILNKTISDIFNEYLISNEYEQKIRSIKRKYEKEYVDKFQEYSKNIIRDFSE